MAADERNSPACFSSDKKYRVTYVFTLTSPHIRLIWCSLDKPVILNLKYSYVLNPPPPPPKSRIVNQPVRNGSAIRQCTYRSGHTLVPFVGSRQ